MPLFFFHVYDGRTALDDEGTELPDVYTAQAEAICMSGEILRDMGAKFWDGTEWRMEVADERSQILFALHFSAEERPALTQLPSDSGSL
jgi:hypothetical protein